MKLITTINNVCRASLGYVPLPLVAWIEANFGRVGRRMASTAVSCRPIQILGGPGKGLWFDAATANPTYYRGTYESPVQDALTARLRRGQVFYDIGANLGFFSMLGAHLVGSRGKVYSFEPLPNHAGRIRRSAALNGFSWVEVREQAVTDRAGSGEIIVTRHHGGATLAETGIVPDDASGRNQVALISIDELVDSGTILPPDFVKIDVEGSEMYVLRGMKETIKQCRPTLIYEVDDRDENRYKTRRRMLDAYVESLAYSVEHLEASYGDVAWSVGHSLAIPVT